MYELKEVTLRNGPHQRKVLVIEFKEPSMAIVGEFLMADANLLNGEILSEIDLVLSGEKESINVSGNRCALHIRENETIISDLFDSLESDLVYDTYKIETMELRTLIVTWLQKLNEFHKKTGENKKS